MDTESTLTDVIADFIAPDDRPHVQPLLDAIHAIVAAAVRTETARQVRPTVAEEADGWETIVGVMPIKIVSRDPGRRTALIVNLDTTLTVTVSGGDSPSTEGFPLGPGASLTVNSTAPVWGYAPSPVSLAVWVERDEPVPL